MERLAAHAEREAIVKAFTRTRELSAQKLLHPDKFRAEVARAMARAKGYVKDCRGQAGAATILGVSPSKLAAWLEEPELASIPRATGRRNKGQPMSDAHKAAISKAKTGRKKKETKR